MKERQLFKPDISEDLINPEEVFGSEFKHLEIIGQGSGSGFEFSGIHLPKDWQNSIDHIKTNINTDMVQQSFFDICSNKNCKLISIDFDPNHILKEIIIENNRSKKVSKLALSQEFHEAEYGIYRAENLMDIESAFVFQYMACQYLNACFSQNQYSYIAGSFDRGFGSINLKIPEKYIDCKTQITDKYFQDKFKGKAHNICGTFGVKLESIFFKDNGILWSCSVIPGDRSYYSLEDSHGREYSNHNVDNLKQAFALHTIVASFLNILIEKDREGY